MKIAEVEARLAQIAALERVPDGSAHELEDALFLDVLKAIAAGASNPAELAAVAIKSADLHIKRWFE
ncbi:TPA: hypothetical protein QDB23_001688 [Burkholderia vietnamiensis]|nr:hypothetical protein [Burkholderia vietnamiensis]